MANVGDSVVAWRGPGYGADGSVTIHSCGATSHDHANRPPQRHARIAGAAYALVIVIGILNGFFIDSRLVVAGNDAATMRNIVADPTRFRVGIAATLVLYALVVLLAWALYEVLRGGDSPVVYGLPAAT